jgi:hypothetical protein
MMASSPMPSADGRDDLAELTFLQRGVVLQAAS